MTFSKPYKDESALSYLNRMGRLGYRMPTVAMIKNDEQIRGCREAGKRNRELLDIIESEVRVGMSTLDIDDIVMRYTRSVGAVPACLNYRGFPKSVCTSLNDVVCHGIPSATQIITDGDILNVDCTIIYDGYFADASRMLCFGNLRSEATELVSLTRASVEYAASIIRPYETTLGDIGYHISRMAREKGFSVIKEIGGHGVGLKMHEDPYVCHVGSLGKGIHLIPGMIFTIEPMINEGTANFTVDEKDGWTVRTADGRLSAQVEYEVLVTEDSYEILCK